MSASEPLLAAAAPLLNLVVQIRYSRHHPDPSQLRLRLIDEVRQFELRAQQAGVNTETILGARYCLCTVLDEAAALTSWGGNGAWSTNSLLVTFHNETWGGEKFFHLLARLSQNPATYRELLLLLYYCLALGFEGRYRVVDNGRTQLQTVKQGLLHNLQRVSPALPSRLSPHWQDQPVQQQLKRFPVPLWALGALAGALALALYVSLSWSLGSRSDQLFPRILASRAPQIELAASAPPNPQAAPQTQRLSHFLAAEIAENLLTVRDESDRSVIVLRGDGLFESGSDALRGAYVPVLSRVADALDATDGVILITGYSDNVPIKTLRFPSNWELSQARADAVKGILQQRLQDGGRLRAQGKGEADPIAPNDSPANRARNRRVEVVLLLAADSGKQP
ncbi:DotU family type VI secretion system protein [Alcaligenes endophyticus]|uniref:DotU family type VI secretion system protein n=1 Tax=Alcaligenes endophyticus TaxID=1929088 RepID=A0ABT8EKQ6_9BURK|nr:DotU family type VI secretion system protein [Alcaligenes endophyticus]MCX5590764.1 DotU family type VI secretion system protein [Alcaligenes endophyticus]MDN4121873.1 DotU family type VI secretion system protein [Alcaligenes endophyticus]